MDEKEHPRRARSRPVSGIVVGLVLAVAIVLAVMETSHRDAVADMYAGRADPVEVAGRLLRARTSPELLTATAEQLIAQGPGHDETAIALLGKAIGTDPRQPFALAQLAFAQTRLAGVLTPQAQEHLARSFEACPLCQKDIVRWRLEFVLGHWEQSSEALRLAAFRGGDLLRWWHLEYEELEALRLEAEAQGIPFRAYQRAVGTPVRPHELDD